MFDQSYPVSGKVEIFPMENPWIYVRVPQKYTKMFKQFAERGLVAITATLGSSTWKTSLLPMGDGSQFIAFKASVRKKEGVKVGDEISLEFRLRER